MHLGYASTIHGAQRATVDTTHTMLAGTETRQVLYVALSRGRRENHLYLSDGEPALDGFAVEMPADYGTREVLTRILERDDRAVSATRASSADPARELVRAIQQYVDALPLLAENVMGDPKMRALDSARTLDARRLQPTALPRASRPDRPRLGRRRVTRRNPPQAAWWQDRAELHAYQDIAVSLARSISISGPVPVEMGPQSWRPLHLTHCETIWMPLRTSIA